PRDDNPANFPIGTQNRKAEAVRGEAPGQGATGRALTAPGRGGDSRRMGPGFRRDSGWAIKRWRMLPLRRAPMLQMAGRMAVLGTETAIEVLARANALAAQGRSIINLGI